MSPGTRLHMLTLRLKTPPQPPGNSDSTMEDPTPPTSFFMSPKRKRDGQDSLMTDAPSPSRLRTTNLPTRPLLEQDLTSESSPRTAVVGRFQDLDLDSHNEIPKLDFGKPTEFQMGKSTKTPLGSGGFNPHIFLPSQTYNAPVTPPPSSDGTLAPTIPFGPQTQKSSLPLEIPETPRLRPVLSPTPPPSATKSKSPPPPSPALWWSDAEITGHDPKDPSDDGYGINGVGFLPTPAIANARTERRKKQVAEWKNREAREARQRRSDRRRRRDADAADAVAATMENEILQGDNGVRADEGRKVRFLEI